MDDIEIFIENLPADWRKTACEKLLQVTLECAPDLEGAIKWGNPYFSHNGKAAIKWYIGKEWINVYFYNGKLIEDPTNLFIETDNKAMRTVKIFDEQPFDYELLKPLLRQAVSITT